MSDKPSCPTCKTTHVRQKKTGEWKCYECKNKPTIVPIQKMVRPFTWNKKKKSKNLIVPSRQEIITIIQNTPSLQTKAFLSLLYVSGCRISEILGLPKKQIEGIKKSQITNEKLDTGEEVLLLNNIPILKRKELMPKDIPIVMIKEEPFVTPIIQYIATLEPDQKLFPFNRHKAWKIVKEHTQNPTGNYYHPHMFRHFRITHLAKPPYQFNTSELVQFIGWSDSRPATTYSHLDWKHTAQKMAR